MSTRAQIAIQIGPEEWAHVYVHYEGYPAHMLPALAGWKPEDILASREIRQVTPEVLDCFDPPGKPRILPRPTREFAHLYMWIGCQWVTVAPEADAGQAPRRPGRVQSENTDIARNYLHLGARQSDCDYTETMQLTQGRPDMTTRRTAATNDKALSAFMTAKAEIDTMLARLRALSADHFNAHPNEVNWGHVGTLTHYASLLRQITDSACKEGEHAE